MRRRETAKTEARRAPEERAAQEYLRYFEQRSDEGEPDPAERPSRRANRRSERIGGRSRRITRTGS